jgi:hypothetical protein
MMRLSSLLERALCGFIKLCLAGFLGVEFFFRASGQAGREQACRTKTISRPFIRKFTGLI